MRDQVNSEYSGGSRSPRPILDIALASALILAAATLLSHYTYVVFSAKVYLPLHSLLEIGSVVVSFSIFALYWKVNRDSLLGVVLYARAYRDTGKRFFMGVAMALALTAASELFFTLYAPAYDTYNLLGHLFKIAAYYTIFSTLFTAAIRRPYLNLERLNDDAENRLKVTIARLEETTRSERQARERAEAAVELLRPLQTVTEAASSNGIAPPASGSAARHPVRSGRRYRQTPASQRGWVRSGREGLQRTGGDKHRGNPDTHGAGCRGQHRGHGGAKAPG